MAVRFRRTTPGVGSGYSTAKASTAGKSLAAKPVSKTAALHEAIGGISLAATQMCLRTSCADVSRVVYMLRLSGDRLSQEDLSTLGKVQREGVGDHEFHVISSCYEINGRLYEFVLAPDILQS